MIIARRISLTILALIALYGCNACAGKPDPIPESQGTLIAATPKTDYNPYASLEKELDDIVSSKTTLLAKAQGESPCDAQTTLLRYTYLADRAKDVKEPDTRGFRGRLNSKVATTGSSAATQAYLAMKANRDPGCADNHETTKINQVEEAITLIEKYGLADNSTPDTNVLRAAALRSLQADVKAGLAEYHTNPTGGGECGPFCSLEGAVQAAEKWRFTQGELGIPADITKKMAALRSEGGL